MGGDPVVIVRSHPKGVFLYPCLVAALVAAALSAWGGDPGQVLAGRVFVVVFAVNLMVFAWDFSRASFLVLVLLGVIAILLAALVEREYAFLGSLARLLSAVDVRARPHFYLCLAGTFAAVLGAAFTQARLDYWRVHENEIMHVTGIIQNVERFPAPSLTFKKVVPNVFEYFLLGAGTIIIEPLNGERHVLPHVPRVDAVERRLEALLSAVDVTVEPDEVLDPDARALRAKAETRKVTPLGDDRA